MLGLSLLGALLSLLRRTSGAAGAARAGGNVRHHVPLAEAGRLRRAARPRQEGRRGRVRITSVGGGALTMVGGGTAGSGGGGGLALPPASAGTCTTGTGAAAHDGAVAVMVVVVAWHKTLVLLSIACLEYCN